MSTNYVEEGSKQATLRQILQQKWSNIEHYDTLDQKLLISIFALSGAAVAISQLEDIHISQQISEVSHKFAVLLAAAALMAVLRSFVEYCRSLSVICSIERALGVDKVIGEMPSLPDRTSFPEVFIELGIKLLRNWRVSLIIIYSIIGWTGLNWIGLSRCWATVITLCFLFFIFIWLVVIPFQEKAQCD